MRAQDIILYSDETSSLSISSMLYLFSDKDGTFTIGDILKDSLHLFSKTTQKIPSFSFTNATIWCRFASVNNTGLPYYLEIAPPILNEIALYQVKDFKVIDSLNLGSFYASNDIFNSFNYIFRLNPEADNYLLKIKSKTRLFVKAQLSSHLALIGKTNKVNTLIGFYAGLILMILIYHLFLYFTSYEKIYLFYILHLVNTLVFFLYVSGIGISLLWPGLPKINSYFLSVMSLGFILSMLFVINFIESRKNLPIIHKLLIGVISLLCLNAVLDLNGFSIIAGKMLNYLGLVSITLIIVASIQLIKDGFRPAYVFLSAWLFYLLGIAVQTLQSLNFISTNEITSNAIQIGSAFEFFLLSIAVGNKINFYKAGKMASIRRGKELTIETQNLKINQKNRLEEQFQEKTELLYAKNRELRKQNKEIALKHREILDQNLKIKEFNELLEVKNLLITRQNTELINHKENLEQLIEERTFELQEATKLAEEADAQKTAFLKNFSHELRTPMNAIAGFSSLLVDMDVEDKLYDYYTGIIVENADNLLELVDNVIDLSKLENDELTLKKVKFNLGKMFMAIRDSAIQKLRKDKKSFVDFILEIPESPKSVYMDYNRLYKIIFQLVDNAVKYTESGFIKLGFTLDELAGNLEIFVIDSGIGIKKEKLDIVFDSFQKVERNKIKFYSGTGLGLSLVKGLIKIMDGKLIVNTISEEELFNGKLSGTNIRVIIPGVFE